MSNFRIGAGVVALMLGAQVAAAQGQGAGMGRDSAMMQQQMRMLDSLSARLDSLSNRMNTATGEQKTAAMVDVVNALVAEHRMIHDHMRQMMANRRAMTEQMGEQRRYRTRRPPARDTTGADSAAADSVPTEPADTSHHP